MQRKAVGRVRQFILPLIVLTILGGIWSAEQMARVGSGPAWLQSIFGESNGGDLRVGLIVGHRGNDSGAVCPDGLTEVEVNTRVVELAAARLRERGIRVDVLDEFDGRLRGYRSDALVSVHSDSCMVPFTGFKVARFEWGSEQSERLVQCLWERYELETGLPRHPDTITVNMTRYHAFRKVAASTPAAIIELGFLNTDRYLLTERPERAAAGVVSGMLCFLEMSR